MRCAIAKQPRIALSGTVAGRPNARARAGLCPALAPYSTSRAAKPLGLRVRRDDAALAGFLCAVQGVVGALEERNRIVLGAQLGYSRREVQLPRLPERPRRDGVEDPPIQLLRVLERRLGEDHGELVAADAAGEVRRPNDIAHALGRLGESGVAREVTHAVVDLLEVVEVEDDQGELPLVAMRAGALARERLVEEAAVEQARERIEVGELPSFAEPARVLDRRAGVHCERLELASVVVAELVRCRDRKSVV